MIVKDEEEALQRLLPMLTFCEELIVVDTGSTDGTAQLFKNSQAKCYSFEWQDHFSKARNYAFRKATKPLVMWLDADDIIFQETAEAIQKIKTIMEDYSMATMQYAPINSPIQYARERIFQRSTNPQFEGAVHEVVVPYGKIYHSPAVIYHAPTKTHGMRNRHIYERQLARGEKLSPRDCFYYARELMFHADYPSAIAYFHKYLQGEGWFVNQVEACQNLSHCYQRLHCWEEAYQALMQALCYAPPSPELCCAIADFLLPTQPQSAKFWYESALTANSYEGAFQNSECRAYYPYVQLSKIYESMGNTQLATAYQNLANQVHAKNSTIQNNKSNQEEL